MTKYQLKNVAFIQLSETNLLPHLRIFCLNLRQIAALVGLMTVSQSPVDDPS